MLREVRVNCTEKVACNRTVGLRNTACTTIQAPRRKAVELEKLLFLQRARAAALSRAAQDATHPSRLWMLLQVQQRVEEKQKAGDNATGLRKYGEALIAYDEALKDVPERHSLRTQLHGSKAAVFIMDGKCVPRCITNCPYKTLIMIAFKYIAVMSSTTALRCGCVHAFFPWPSCIRPHWLCIDMRIM